MCCTTVQFAWRLQNCDICSITCRCQYMEHLEDVRAPVTLAKAVADYGEACLPAILRPDVTPVPRLPASNPDLRRCQLFPRPQGQAFATLKHETFFSTLFNHIVRCSGKIMPQVRICRVASSTAVAWPYTPGEGAQYCAVARSGDISYDARHIFVCMYR